MQHQCTCGRDHTEALAQGKAANAILEGLGLYVEMEELRWSQDMMLVDDDNNRHVQSVQNESWKLKARDEKGEWLLSTFQGLYPFKPSL